MNSRKRQYLTSQLNFPALSTFDRHKFPDVVFQTRAVVKTAKGVKHLWDPII